MPFVHFIVTKVRKDEAKNTYYINILELPYQNHLSLSKEMPISFFKIIWVDENIGNFENQGYARVLKEKFNGLTDVDTVRNYNEAIQLIWNTVYAIIIVSGALGQSLVPQVHNLKTVRKIGVFCMNKEKHKKWAAKFRKVKFVSTNFDEVLRKTHELYEQEIHTPTQIGQTMPFKLIE